MYSGKEWKEKLLDEYPSGVLTYEILGDLDEDRYFRVTIEIMNEDDDDGESIIIPVIDDDPVEKKEIPKDSSIMLFNKKAKFTNFTSN